MCFVKRICRGCGRPRLPAITGLAQRNYFYGWARRRDVFGPGRLPGVCRRVRGRGGVGSLETLLGQLLIDGRGHADDALEGQYEGGGGFVAHIFRDGLDGVVAVILEIVEHLGGFLHPQLVEQRLEILAVGLVMTHDTYFVFDFTVWASILRLKSGLRRIVFSFRAFLILVSRISIWSSLR